MIRITNKSAALFLAILLGCVDKVDFSNPTQVLPVVIDGSISDAPGPDTVRISKAYPADGEYHYSESVEGAVVQMVSDAGEVDFLTDIGFGYYITNSIQGTIGRTYRLLVSIPAGSGVYQYESVPQRMLPAGEIDSIYYAYVSEVNTSTGLEEDGFDVYVNSKVSPSSSRRLRYKFFGTYQIATDASVVQFPIPCPLPPCPTRGLPCAEGECSCCTCWATVKESSPIQLTHPEALQGTSFNRVLVQRIPINNYTFNSRYRIEISQMELSEDAFEFFRAIKEQEENSSSLFQPPFSEIKSNIRPVADAPPVLGVFYAAAVTRKHIYINRSDIPFFIFSDLIAGDCRAVVPNSSNQKPSYWE